MSDMEEAVREAVEAAVSGMTDEQVRNLATDWLRANDE